jgi:hypothetical protein
MYVRQAMAVAKTYLYCRGSANFKHFFKGAYFEMLWTVIIKLKKQS